MTREFTEREKETIRSSLLQKGREFFCRYGLKKTGIADLAGAAGIAQGSFYLFFNSKEELYFEILEAEEQIIREKFLADFTAPGKITRELIKDFLKKALAILETNPLIRHLVLEGEFETLLRKLPSEKLAGHIKRDEAVLLPLLRHWQDEAQLIGEKPEIVAGVIRALFALPLHKNMIGEDIYDAVIDLLTGFIAGGLIRNGGQDSDH